MNSKTTITLSVIAIVAAVVLFTSGPLVTTHQAMAFPFHSGFGFHHGFGWGGWNGWGC
ncbi:MAG: hypothetical protein WAK17_30060 [Candidatus Nitrosopolaris sp.]